MNDTFTVNATTDAFSAIEITGISGVFRDWTGDVFSGKCCDPSQHLDTDHEDKTETEIRLAAFLA